MENNTIFIKAFPIQWILTIIVAVVLFFTVSDVWAYSFVLGSATSLMMMSMMYKSTKKVLVEQRPDASKRVVRNYIFRYLFYTLILVVSVVTGKFEVFAVAIGMISFKISLYISIFLDKRGESV